MATSQNQSYHTYQATQTPLFSNSLCYSGVSWMSNLLKISSDIESDFRNGFFSTLHIDLKDESNF